MRKKFILPIAIILLLSISLPVMAVQIQVNAFVNENRLELGQSTTLTIQIQGSKNISAPEINLPDWQVQYYGPSTQISIVNGRRTESVSHLYSLTPLKTGQLEIPSIEVQYRGQRYQTRPIQMTVDERGQGQSKTLAEQVKDYVFLEVDVDQEKIYLNEEIPVTINLFFHQDVQLKNIHYPELALENQFLQSQFTEPKQTYKLRNGQYFNVIPFKTTLQAISKGRYNFRPSLTADLVIPRQSRSFFDDNYDLYTMTLQSPEITLEVKEFPAQGKPVNFKGTVGSFHMEVTVTPKEVKVGEPITIRTRFTGEGNYNTLVAPTIDERPEFKYYEPQLLTKDESDAREQPYRAREKVYEQVVIPMEEVDTLPTISFSYFEPKTEMYRTIQRSNLGIQVSGGMGAEGDSSRQVMDYRNAKSTDASTVLGQDILYIKSTPGRFKPVDQGLFTVGTIGYPVVLLLMLLAGAAVKWRLDQESPAQRRRKEVTVETRKILKEGEQLLDQQDKMAFYNIVYQAMQNYLKEYFEITITGISDYENQVLVKAGVEEKMLEKIEHFYRKMDEMRYAGSVSSETDLKQILGLAEEIVTGIAKGEVA